MSSFEEVRALARCPKCGADVTGIEYPMPERMKLDIRPRVELPLGQGRLIPCGHRLEETIVLDVTSCRRDDTPTPALFDQR